MKALLLSALLLTQDPSADVARHVEGGDYFEALAAAQGAEGPERSLLITWTRHHAGDLQGALAEAAAGLVAHPENVLLLEQATWISASLHRGRESMAYAQRLQLLGHPSASTYIADARALLLVTEEVRSARIRSHVLLGACSLLALLVAWWGTRPVTA